MKKLVLILSILTLTQFAIAQTDTNIIVSVALEEVHPPVLFAEVDAVPLIGMQEWFNIISKHCQVNYPDADRENGVGGKVFADV